MNPHKTRPTLNELEQMPLMSLRREIAQLCVDAALADNGEVLADAEALAMAPDPEPERIVELWRLLRGQWQCALCGLINPPGGHMHVNLDIPERLVRGRMDGISDSTDGES